MNPADDSKQTLLVFGRPFDPEQGGHYLTVVRGQRPGCAVRIGSEALVLGRDAERPFHLADPGVSRSHCEVRLQGSDLVVRDLASTNGTYLDGIRVEAGATRPLAVSGLLQVGKHMLRHDLLTEKEFERQEQLARDFDRARRHVEALLPAPLQSGPLRVEWSFVPSTTLGGDALGYGDLGDGRLAVYVVDACGHGVGAALHAASVLNALRTRTLPGVAFDRPAEVLRGLNDAFQIDRHNGMYFSIWYGVLDPRAHSLVCSAAGHPPALLLGPGDLAPRRIAVRNPPIGTRPSCSFDQVGDRFEPGDRLYVFTDGAYELRDRDGVEHGLDDLERTLVDLAREPVPGDGAQRLYDAALRTAGEELLSDDFTMVVVRFAGTDGA